MRKTARNSWTLLAAGIFFVSIFTVALKLMNPTEIHIHLQGEETILTQILREYTVYDVALVIASSFLAGLSAMYLLLQRPSKELQLPYMEKIANYERILPTLKEDEQKILQAVLDSDGLIPQSELSDITGVSKSNVSRCLDLLESRGYVERRRRGMGNIIVLK